MKMMLEDEDGMEQEQGEEDRNRQRALDDEEGKEKRWATATNHGPACSKDSPNYSHLQEVTAAVA